MLPEKRNEGRTRTLDATKGELSTGRASSFFYSSISGQAKALL